MMNLKMKMKNSMITIILLNKNNITATGIENNTSSGIPFMLVYSLYLKLTGTNS